MFSIKSSTDNSEVKEKTALENGSISENGEASCSNGCESDCKRQRMVVLDNIETFSFVTDGHGLKQEQVEIAFDIEKFGKEEDKETRANIERVWEEETSKNSRLFNKSKFRLAGFKYNSNTGGARLDIGVTDYKDLKGTNLASYVNDLMEEGEDRFARMSQAVGVGGFAITTDLKVVLVKRAGWTGEQAGMVDRPGGHAEPEEALGRDVEKKNDFDEITEEKVARELFESVQKELRDEINIPLSRQKAPELLGVIYNLEAGGRAGLDFLIRLDMNQEEVLKEYSSGKQAEADETTGIIFVDIEDIMEDRIDVELVNKFTPHLKGGLRLLKECFKK